MELSKDINLYLATPAYGSMVSVGYTSSLVQTTGLLMRMGIKHSAGWIPGDSLVPRARGVLVAKFMAGAWTHLMFIDGDLSWNPEVIPRLLLATQHDGIEIVGGIYPKKSLPPEFPVNFMQGSDKKMNQHPVTGFPEIKDVPNGFLMVKRSAIERMMAAYPERKCSFRQETPVAELPFEYDLFSCFIDSDQRYLSEDFGFSRLWQRIGGHIWMDPSIQLSHFGTYEYKADVSQLLMPSDLSTRPTNAQQIEGWMLEKELEFLAGCARNVDSIAEIGCWKGRSTFALLSNCDGDVYAVDHWLGSIGERETSSSPHAEAVTGDVFSQFMRNVGHFPNLIVVKKPSIEAVQQVPEVDMVFVDGGHAYAEVLTDLRTWLPRAKKLICGHDFNFPDVKRAVNEVLGEVRQGPGSLWIKEL